MKYCKDCKFYEAPRGCHHPAGIEFSCMVDGKPPPDIKKSGAVNAAMCRLSTIMCGPDALWWEAPR